MLFLSMSTLFPNEAQYLQLPHRVHFSVRKTLSVLKSTPASSVHSVSKHIVLILSGCQQTIISGMTTERHNVANRHTMKAISKGSLAGCLVHLDAGSTNSLAQQNLQIPEHANNRTIPSWLIVARLSVRERHISSRPDAFLVTTLPIKNSNR